MADKVRYTPVDPTEDYPYTTDEQFIKGQYPGAQEHDDPEDERTTFPGLVEPPTMDDEGGESTGIYEFDGKFYVLPTQVNGEDFSGQAAEDRFRATGEHLGVFDSLESALDFEKKYLGKLEIPDEGD